MRKLIVIFPLLLILPHLGMAASKEPKVRLGLKIQILLDRAGFSPGEIDGNFGHNTKRAIEAFQKEKTLDVTGKADQVTLKVLTGDQGAELLIPYTITEHDVAAPFVKEIPKDFMEQSKLESLNYTSPMEALGEKFQSNPALLKALNKNVEFKAGDEILVPNVSTDPHSMPGPDYSQTQTQTTHAKQTVTVIVDQQTSSVTALNDSGDVIFHAPATLGSDHDPLPLGEWKITGVSRNPVFQYNPELFWDADPAQAKAKVPSGPNNPVGVVWIDISKEHYGMHGTPEPRRIGYSESYGCVRMTNWDAAKLASLVKPGTKVIFQ